MSKYNMDDLNSDIPPLDVPEFKSTIPAHLTGESPAHVKYIIESLSIIEQQNKWMINVAIETNTQVRKTNGRVNKHDVQITDLNKFESKVNTTLRVTSWIAGSIAGAITFSLACVGLIKVIAPMLK